MTSEQNAYTNFQGLSAMPSASSEVAEEATHAMHTNALRDVASISDAELLTRARRWTRAERQATAALIAQLSEIDRRRLFAGEG